MKKIRIYRHVDCEGPGYLWDFLQSKNIAIELNSIDAGEKVKDSLEDVDALVFMGGSMSVNDDLPWIHQELSIIRSAAARGMPILGHCLGGQLIAKALGADVGKNPVKEIGWFEVWSPPEENRASVLLQGLPKRFNAFHWHGETFSLPDGAQWVLTNDNCRNQAFVLDNMLALQCHVEMTEELVKIWVSRFAEELQKEHAVQGRDDILQCLSQRVSDLNSIAKVMYENWISSI